MKVTTTQSVPRDKRIDYDKEDGKITEQTRQRLLASWQRLNQREVNTV